MDVRLTPGWGCYVLVAEDGREMLIEKDSECLVLAEYFGWQCSPSEGDLFRIHDAVNYLNDRIGDLITIDEQDTFFHFEEVDAD